MLRQLAADEADFLQLAQALVDARQQRAAGNGRHDVVGIAPAKLLRDLEAHRLRALGVVAPKVDVGEAPAVLVRDLRAQPVHVVVVAFDGDDGRLVDRGAENLVRLEVVRDEDVARQAEPRRMRGDAAGQVAGGRAAEHREPELHRPRGRNGDDAVLVGERRMVDRVVLDEHFRDAKLAGQARRANERREAGVEPGLRLFNRQQLEVAPRATSGGTR